MTVYAWVQLVYLTNLHLIDLINHIRIGRVCCWFERGCLSVMGSLFMLRHRMF